MARNLRRKAGAEPGLRLLYAIALGQLKIGDFTDPEVILTNRPNLFLIIRSTSALTGSNARSIFAFSAAT
ncbi:MAG: hypothetical protein CMM73_04035 [Rhodospirillaceae bacterium]|nr:hypothetical protein [Rhodospirillaceae bacterium]|tara:strand:+ start:1759 stop:1968 length:210 start_codon:yes stop_codon:yes gene_type:complete